MIFYNLSLFMSLLACKFYNLFAKLSLVIPYFQRLFSVSNCRVSPLCKFAKFRAKGGGGLGGKGCRDLIPP